MEDHNKYINAFPITQSNNQYQITDDNIAADQLIFLLDFRQNPLCRQT